MKNDYTDCIMISPIISILITPMIYYSVCGYVPQMGLLINNYQPTIYGNRTAPQRSRQMDHGFGHPGFGYGVY